MKYYEYGNDGYLMAERTAIIDARATKRLRKDVYSKKPNSTFVAPPPAKDGYRIKWDGSAWNYEEIPVPPAPPAPPEPTKEEILNEKIGEHKALLNGTDWVQSKLGEKFLFKLLEVYARDGTTGIERLDEVMEYMTPLMSQYAKVYAERETARAEINRKEKQRQIS